MRNRKRTARSKTNTSRSNGNGREKTLNADQPATIRHADEEELDFEEVLAEDGRRANLTAVRHGSSHNEKYASMRVTRRGSDQELAA